MFLPHGPLSFVTVETGIIYHGGQCVDHLANQHIQSPANFPRSDRSPHLFLFRLVAKLLANLRPRKMNSAFRGIDSLLQFPYQRPELICRWRPWSAGGSYCILYWEKYASSFLLPRIDSTLLNNHFHTPFRGYRIPFCHSLSARNVLHHHHPRNSSRLSGLYKFRRWATS